MVLQSSVCVLTVTCVLLLKFQLALYAFQPDTISDII